MHSHWRDCQEWTKLGLPLSTTSNEACKMYDAVLTQHVGWYDDDSVGGLDSCLNRLLQADPNFVMGKVLANGLELIGTGKSIHRDRRLQESMDDLIRTANISNLNPREGKHVQAVKLWAEGDMTGATSTWEEILLEHPTDMLAIKMAYDTYIYLGQPACLRDSIARVFPSWRPSMPLASYLHGMYAFGLVETNLFDQAERIARKGLEINPIDATTTHSMAHVLEEAGRHDDGVAFMSETLPGWSSSVRLACHNFWHWALYHIEKADYAAALDIFDNECYPRSRESGALTEIADACSLLYRLNMEGVDVGSRWEDLYQSCRHHTDDHTLVFNDLHLLMCCLGAKEDSAAEQLVESLKEFVSENQSTQSTVAKDVGVDMCEAFLAYDEGSYARAVDLMAPLQDKVVAIGGSNAERDVFDLVFIHAAMKSPDKRHQQLARTLLLDRKAAKESAPMTDRLIAKAMAMH